MAEPISDEDLARLRAMFDAERANPNYLDRGQMLHVDDWDEVIARLEDAEREAESLSWESYGEDL